jgi:hypothetical protein
MAASPRFEITHYHNLHSHGAALGTKGCTKARFCEPVRANATAPSSRAQLRESGAWAWIVLPGWEGAMEQRSQETTPLWVWFSLGLLVIAIIAYAVGYLMFEEMF